MKVAQELCLLHSLKIVNAKVYDHKAEVSTSWPGCKIPGPCIPHHYVLQLTHRNILNDLTLYCIIHNILCIAHISNLVEHLQIFDSADALIVDV
jgi:hypothetical protein